MAKFTGRNLSVMLAEPAPAPVKVVDPVQVNARLAVTWIGHATVLIQIDDRFILTDPVLTSTVGQISKRLVEPGVDFRMLPRLDAVLISHMHFDHLSLGTLEMIDEKIRRLFVPREGLVYVPNKSYPTIELHTWQTWEREGLRITAVPVQHLPWRYAGDRDWMETAFTGYVIESRGVTVFFGGDTAYHPQFFKKLAERFPRIDLAILPIGPVEPRDYMQYYHVDPRESLQVFLDVGARWMMPMHFDTFYNSFDNPGELGARLQNEMQAMGIAPEKVPILPIGGQHVYLEK